MLRRRFLSSNEWPRTAAPFLGLTPEEPEELADYSLIRVSRRAMATRFEIALPYGTPDAVAAAEDALDLIDELEDQLTVYREHSEISRLNATAFEQAVIVEDRLFELLNLSAQLTHETREAFDIAAGGLIKAWGFHRREGRIPNPQEHAAAMRATGIRHVIFDSAAKSVRFRKPGLELNLGSIGKGYALDRTGELLREKWGIRSALLHGGGSSVLAIGSPPNDRRGWPIAIRHPTNVSITLGTVRLKDNALATSAATFQHFEYKGKQYAHVLDPRTGWPAKDVASASAIANSAAEADALATAYFVLGLPEAKEIRRDGAGVILVDAAGVEPEMFGMMPGKYAPPTLRETLETLLTLPEV